MSDNHYVLEILSADGETTTRTLHPESVVIGRRQGDIVIDDTGASGRHAELRLVNGAVEVSDLGSTNGIVWEGAIVREPFSLTVDQTFQIGRTKFTVTKIQLRAPEPVEPEEEESEEESEEATAFISASDLGMADTPATPPEPVAQAPIVKKPATIAKTPEPVAPEPIARPPEPVAKTPEPVAPEPIAKTPEPIAKTPEPVAKTPEPVAKPPEPVAVAQDDEEEEEATAWMTAMDDDAPAGDGEGSVSQDDSGPLTSDGAWADEAAAQPVQPVEVGPSTLVDDAPVASATNEVVVIGERRPNFQGEGGEIFKLFFLQGLLVLVTFGIYTPWFLCKFWAYLASRTVYGPTQSGWVYPRFHGTGGALVMKFLIGYLLCAVTLGIYGAWFICDLARWFLERSDAVAEDGTVYQAQFNMSGGQLLGAVLVNYFLTMLSFGIYGAWAYCTVRSKVVDNIHIFENGEHVGGCQFTAKGGDLLPFALVQWLLCTVTLFIYVPWAVVNVTQFMNRHTRVYYRERWFQCGFTGTGGEYFVLNLVGILLTQLTFGIYYAWFYAKKRTFETNHEVWRELT